MSSEQELRLLVEGIPALVWRAAPEGNIDYVNKRVLEYLGAPLDEVIGWGWMEKVHPDDVAFKVRTWPQNLESGNPHDAVCRIRGADGQYRSFAVRAEPLRAGDGRVLRWYGVLVDIDEAKKAEEQPRSVAQLQATLNVIPAHTWYAAPSGGLTFVNKRTADYLGLPKDHPLRFGTDIGAQWDAHIPLLHPDDHEDTLINWSTRLRTGESGEGSFRVRNAQGDYRWFLSRVEPLRASDGTLLQWVGVNLDIEELKCAEQALRESEYKLRQIVETVPGLLWSTDPAGEPTQLNQRMLDYSGMRFEDFSLGGWEAFVHPNDFPETARAFSHAIQTGTSHQAVNRLRRADGEFRWHHTRGEPLRDRQGCIIQWYGLSIDIHEAKQAEDRLRRSEAYLAGAQRLSHTGSFGWTPSTGELHWSDEIFRILEYDSSVEPTMERVLQRIHPDDLAMMRQLFDETSSGEKDFDTTHRLLMPDGSVKFVHVLSHALKDAAGNLEIAGAVMDVTENILLYQDLAEREAKIRRLVDSNIIGIFIWEAEGRILEANDAFLQMVGYDRNDLIAGRLHRTDLTPPEWRDRTARALVELKMTGTIRPYEKEFFRKDGSRVPVLLGAVGFDETANQGVTFALDLTERKRAEEALRRSETYLAEAQRLTHTGSWAYDPAADRTIYWSEELFRIFGLDPRRSSSPPDDREIFRLVHPEDRERFSDLVAEALRNKADYAADYRIVLPDRTVRHIHTIGRPVLDETGLVIERVGTAVDVTERKRAEEELRASEARFRTFVDHATDAFMLHGEAGTVLDVNRHACESLGNSRDELIGMAVANFDPDANAAFLQTILERLDVGEILTFERRHRRKDGTVFPVEVRVREFRKAGRRLVLSLTRDITERKRAERAATRSAEALRRSEAYLAEAERLSHTGTWAVNLKDERTIVYWSEESYRIYGLDPLQGLPTRDWVWQQVHPDDRTRLYEEIQEAVRQKRDYVVEFRILLPDGTIKYLEAIGHHVFSAHGELLEVMGTHVDVTERKRAQDELERLRQLESNLAHMNRLSMMGELAASLAHEIAQPIGSARNNARAALNFLDKQPPELGEVREALGCVVGNARSSGRHHRPDS